MADLSQAQKPNNDAFFLNEAYVVWEIAFNEALSMQQNPGFVHLAAACLYRLREFDLALAKEIGITVYHMRDWARTNLPTANASGHRYEGDIDFDYTVERRADKMHVRKVKKPNKAPRRTYPDHVHPPGEGLTVRERIDPAASELWAAAMRSTYEFAERIYDGSGDEESPANTLGKCLVSLLATTEVQGCLEDVGFSPGELRRKLGERD